jgi:hypothetical protein
MVITQFDPNTNTVYIESKQSIPTSITLTAEEWRKAGHFAVDRRADSVNTATHNIVKNKGFTLNTEVDQVAAVLAAAKALGKPATLNRGTFQPDNVGGIRVRHSPQPKAKLRVYDDQPDHEKCLLVVGRGYSYRLVGWATAGEVRRQGQKESLNGSQKQCWTISQALLKPISELAQ